MTSSRVPRSPTSPLVDLIFIGSGPEALIELQVDTWELGRQAAAQSSKPLQAIAEVLRAAERACDEALGRYVPLDEARFRDIFTLAWSAGYCSFARAGGRRKRVPTA